MPAAGMELDELLASPASDPTGFLDRLREALAGEFIIIRELGRGGMGRVYLAHEVALDRRVAMKVMPPDYADHPGIVQRFEREARMAGKLSHPNIVPVFQVSERAHLYFFTMPYVAGPSLRQILRQTPRLNFDVARRYLREAADALNYAHAQGVIHRDIKPENMLMEGSRDGRLMLTDFGIAKALGAATTLTRPGDMMGTPFFMSPEQCEEAERVDGRSDQYSLGLVGYEMLAGRFPFTADSLAGIVYKHVHEYPEPLEKIRPEVPADLRQVIKRAIRKDPDERFDNMAEFKSALGGRPTGRTRETGRSPETAPKTGALRRGRWIASAVIVAAGLVVGGTIIFRQLTSPAGPEDGQQTELDVPGEQGGQPGGGDQLTFDVVPSDTGDAAAGGESEGSGDAEPEQATTAANTEQQPDERMLAARRQAEQAHGRADQARQTALEMGADTVFPDRLAAIDIQLAAAERAMANGEIVAAAATFGAATQRFADLALDARQWQEDAAAAQVGHEQLSGEPADPDSLAANTTADEALPPREAILELLEAYRVALESKDVEQLVRDVYGGPIPEADREFLDQLFENAEGIELSLDVGELEVSGGQAYADVEQKMRYNLSRTREGRTLDMSLRMFFELIGQSWRLRNFER